MRRELTCRCGVSLGKQMSLMTGPRRTVSPRHHWSCPDVTKYLLFPFSPLEKRGKNYTFDCC